MLVETFLIFLGFTIKHKRAKVVISRKGDHYTISENGGAVALAAFERKVARMEGITQGLVARDPIDIGGGKLTAVNEGVAEAAAASQIEDALPDKITPDEFDDLSDSEVNEKERFIISYKGVKRGEEKMKRDIKRLGAMQPARGRAIEEEIHVGEASIGSVLEAVRAAFNDYGADLHEGKDAVWEKTAYSNFTTVGRTEKKDSKKAEKPDRTEKHASGAEGSAAEEASAAGAEGGEDASAGGQHEPTPRKGKKTTRAREASTSSESSDSGSDDEHSSTETETDNAEEEGEEKEKAAFLKRMARGCGGIGGDQQTIMKEEPALFDSAILKSYGIYGQHVKAFKSAMGSRNWRPWNEVWDCARNFVHALGYKIDYEEFGDFIRAFYAARRGAYELNTKGIKSTPTGPVPLLERPEKEKAKKDRTKKK